LKESQVISGTPIDVFKAYNTVVKLLKDATQIKVVSSILIPDIKPLFDMFVAEKDMHIIVTEEVLYPSIEEVGRAHLQEALGQNFKLYKLKQNPKIGFFTVTDHFMALVPYRSDGVFDWPNDLLSCNKTAIDWGLALFEHFAKISDRVEIS
jgi:predicted transcriptional regulator